MVEEDGAGRGRNDAGNIGVLEDDVGRLAAEFERNLFQVAGRGVDDQLADFGRAGEGYLVDMRMGGQRGAGRFAVTGNDVHDAIGNTGFLNEFAQAKSRKRSLFGRLQHHGASRRQSRAQLPAAISSGKFQGMICPTTPTGSRSV